MKMLESKVILRMFVFVLVMVAIVKETKGQPTCDNTFFSALVQLVPCQPAVTPFNPIAPTEACCAALQALGQPCFCALIIGPPIFAVDRTMAIQLPAKCTADFEPCWRRG